MATRRTRYHLRVMSEAYDETSYISRRNKALKEVHRIYAEWSDWEKLEINTSVIS